tara:strand:- start:1 stop:561 length:561 start_codon:yes stop_codon:yes gene_type:complete
MLGIKLKTLMAKFRRNNSGEAMISFGILLPALVLISFGVIETSLVVFDFHRASEATRRAARMAIVQDPIMDSSEFASGSEVTCTSTGGIVTCGGVALGTTATFDEIITNIQLVLPNIMPANLEIVYSDSGLGDVTTPGGIIPLVTVRLKNLYQNFKLIGNLPGLPSGFIYPDFETSQMGGGLGAAS